MVVEKSKVRVVFRSHALCSVAVFVLQEKSGCGGARLQRFCGDSRMLDSALRRATSSHEEIQYSIIIQSVPGIIHDTQ